jgi:hypothetical protein
MDGLVARSLEHADESNDEITAHTSVVHCLPERSVISLAALRSTGNRIFWKVP